MRSSLACISARITAMILLVAVAACEPEGAAQQIQPELRVEYNTSDLTSGLSLPFSESARVGDLLFLSGMIGTRHGTLELVPGGMEAESRQALENIRHMLESAGGSIRDVVKCTVMLDDMAQWPAFNQVYVEFFGDHRPARSAFGTDGLALGAVVEIECIAVVREPGTM